MSEVRYVARARQDLKEIFAFIAENNPRRALSFTEELRQAFRNRAAFPRLGRQQLWLRDGIYFGVHANYVYYYQALEQNVGIRILHVFHGARDHQGIMQREQQEDDGI